MEKSYISVLGIGAFWTGSTTLGSINTPGEYLWPISLSGQCWCLKALQGIRTWGIAMCYPDAPW